MIKKVVIKSITSLYHNGIEVVNVEIASFYDLPYKVVAKKYMYDVDSVGYTSS